MGLRRLLLIRSDLVPKDHFKFNDAVSVRVQDEEGLPPPLALRLRANWHLGRVSGAGTGATRLGGLDRREI